MSYFSYIGKLNSPGFFWNDVPPEANSGNTPTRIIPKEFSLGLGFCTRNCQLLERESGLGGQAARLGSLGPSRSQIGS